MKTGLSLALAALATTCALVACVGSDASLDASRAPTDPAAPASTIPSGASSSSSGASASCNAPLHVCDNACVAQSARACGASCAVCPSVQHGSAACDGIGCTIACEAGYEACANTAEPGGQGCCAVSGSVLVTAGGKHTCAVNAMGALYCWGNNEQGQLGIGTKGFMAGKPKPALVSLTGVVGIAAGNEHTCAWTRTRELFCWGSNQYGQLAGTDAERTVPTRVALADVVEAIAGLGHTCARTLSGDVYCWGYGAFGSLGTGSTNNEAAPKKVALADVTALTGKYLITCARTRGAGVYCWGDNRFGQLGVGDTTPTQLPRRLAFDGLPSGDEIMEVAPGYQHVCARSKTGVLYCWGSNRAGQLSRGNSDATPATKPARHPISGVTSIANGFEHGLAVDIRNTAFAWGANDDGQLGNTTTETVNLAEAIYPVFAKTVIAGDRHSCLIDTRDRILCWGDDSEGATGTGVGGTVKQPKYLDPF